MITSPIPGTLDLQVNGFAGVDFNSDAFTADDLHLACKSARQHGAQQILATIITDSTEAMTRRLARLAAFREADDFVREVIAGFHVEGPFLNETPGFIGAHPAEHARPADLEITRLLLNAGRGLVKLMTLAPERDPNFTVTRFLVSQKVTVSAGHCDPSLEILRAAADAGLSMFTHLGNGCPQHLHRHDNIIQRALSLADRLWLCFVVDGAHVPLPALQNYWRCAGLERVIAVTDCISAAGLGPGRYTLGPRVVEIGEDLIAWGDAERTHFAGSTATMRRVREVCAQAGLTEAETDLITVTNPRRALGMAD